MKQITPFLILVILIVLTIATIDVRITTTVNIDGVAGQEYITK